MLKTDFDNQGTSTDLRYRYSFTGDGHFLKKTKIPELRPCLERESAFDLWLNKQKFLGEPQIKAPEPIGNAALVTEGDEIMLVTKTINGQPLTGEHSQSEPNEQRQVQIGSILGRILRQMNSLPPLTSCWGSSLEKLAAEDMESCPFNNPAKKVWDWMSDPEDGPVALGLLSKEEVKAAQGRIEAATPDLEGGYMQHGDFVPWHVMAANAGQDTYYLMNEAQGKSEAFTGDRVIYYLVDGEKASPAKPRYYDLAYLVARCICKHGWYPMAFGAIGEFNRHLPLVQHKQFRTVFDALLLLRSLGLVRDSLIDYRVSARNLNYRSRAVDFFRFCLGGERLAESLLEGRFPPALWQRR